MNHSEWVVQVSAQISNIAENPRPEYFDMGVAEVRL
jgi:hypothetical protein